MEDLVEGSELPLLSADPHKIIVGTGSPLCRFKGSSQTVQYFTEHQIIPRTNDFRPTQLVRKADLKHLVTKIFKDMPELSAARLPRSELLNILSTNADIERKFESIDPLVGNSLAITKYINNSQLFLFSAGPSLSNLIILSSEKKPFEFEKNTTVDLPLDSITIHNTIDLQYPIRQITISSLSTLEFKIFAIRTTSTIHLFTLDSQQAIKQIHTIHLAQKTEIKPSIDYSMPIHVEMSPFREYQYVFITNNGYTAIVDGLEDKFLYEDVDDISDNLSYCSRWRSCAFGRSPFTILVASPECIQEKEFTHETVKTNIFTQPNDCIIAFKPLSLYLYCFATLEHIVVMDQLVPKKPILTWSHQLRGGAFCLLTDQIKQDKWRIMAFSRDSQYASMLEFSYSSTSALPVPKILELHNLELSVHAYEELYDFNSRMRPVGILFKTNQNNPTTGDSFCSLYRLFEDGSIKVHYIALCTSKSKQENMLTQPTYQITHSHPKFDALLKQVKKAMLPERQHIRETGEIMKLDTKHFHAFFQEYANEVESNTIDERLKSKIASKARQIQFPVPYRDLFDETHQHYALTELESFLDQMQQFEPIERIQHIKIPGVIQDNDHHRELHQKLKKAHDKEIQLSNIILRPLPAQDHHGLEYLHHATFKSTITSQVLANCWTLDNTKHSDIVFPEYDTNSVPVPETFPSIKKRKSQYVVPEILLDDDEEDDLPDLPVVVKTVNRSLPARLKHKMDPDQEEEEEEPLFMSSQHLLPSSPRRPTTQSSHQPPSPARAFTNVSTQPLSGAFGSRQKSVAKKKKKPKTSGFK